VCELIVRERETREAREAGHTAQLQLISLNHQSPQSRKWYRSTEFHKFIATQINATKNGS